MSDIINNLLAQANAAAEASGIDMNEAVSGGGGARLLPAGWAFAQLVEYVELGNHPQEYSGKAKDPALEVQLGFALTGAAPDPKDPSQFITYNNDDGSPYIMRPYPFAVSRNEKARAFLLFKALNWKGTAKSFAQLLSQKWLVKIVHEAKSKTDATIVSRMDIKSFLPPTIAAGPQAGQMYQIADADPSLYRLFLWDRPTQEGWDSLKVEGSYEVEEGGKKVQKSKNRVQEKILSALNFQGSPLQLMLGGAVQELPGAPAAPVEAPAAAVQPAQQVAAAPAAAVPATPPQAAVAPVEAPAAPLAPPAATTTHAHAGAVPAAAPAGVQVPVTPVVTTPAVPSNPVLPV